MTPNNTYTEALRGLASLVTGASNKVDYLRKRRKRGDWIPEPTLQRAEHAENFAREAFAVAVGERVGTPQFTALLAQYAALEEVA